ncbi:MAG: hypothetical protein ACRENA_02620 [Vulcanimicrobiaceae bacterium]
MNNAGAWIGIAIAVIIVIAIIAAISRRQRTEHLQKKFGPEYERHVRTIGSQSKAESELLAREERYRKLNIRPLSPEARTRYLNEWHALQSGFVDDPRVAIGQADQVIERVMRDRGYPIGDFNRQTEDLSVEHSDVLGDYRVAHAIAQRSAAGTISTEEMRKAVVAYRELFERLVNPTSPTTTTTTSKEIKRERTS